MFKTVLLTVILVHFVQFSGSPKGLAHGQRFQASIGGSAGSQGGQGGISVSGGLGGFISKIIKWIWSMVSGVITLPITIPKDTLKIVGSVVVDIVTLNFGDLVKLPLKPVAKIFSVGWGSIRGTIQTAYGVLVDVKDLNANVLSGVTDSVNGILGWVIKRLASVNIFGIKTFYNVAMWMNGRVDQLTSAISDIIIWVCTETVNGVNGAVRILHVKDILNLPGLKQIVEMLKGIHNWNSDQIFKLLTELYNFICSIIYQHKDFFLPIFEWILNILKAMENAWATLRKGGVFSEVLPIVENVNRVLKEVLPEGFNLNDIYGNAVDYVSNTVKSLGGSTASAGGNGSSEDCDDSGEIYINEQQYLKETSVSN